MLSILQPVGGLYLINNHLYARAVKGVDHQSCITQPCPETNPLLWVAGHITQMRFRVCGLLGYDIEFPWPGLFSRGKQFDPAKKYPHISEVNDTWSRATEKLNRSLKTLSPEELAQPVPRQFPHQDNTILGALTFYLHHESYHIGQMSYIRRCLGLESLIK